MTKPLSAVLIALAVVASAAAQDAPPLPTPALWFHVMNNTDNDATTAKVYALMERAAKAGYTGMSYHDGRFTMRRFQTPGFEAKVAKLRAKATELKLAIAASVAPMGYGDEMLMNDLDLAEGMPVRKAPFIVRGGRLVAHDPGLRLRNGGLEEWVGGKAVGWDIDDLGTASFRDEAVKAEGASSLRMTDIKATSEHGRTRLIQRIAVQPHRNYAVSAMVRTEASTNRDIRIMGLDRHPLNWTTLPIEETMDWKRIGITFNSLESTEVGIYLGTWGGGDGTMWWDDVRIEPAGFVNVIRRDSLPLTVTSEDGATTYVEGRDFAAVADPLLAPCVSGWHQQPEVAVPAGSRLVEGQVVLASYHHAMTNLQVNNTPVCMSCEKVYDEIRHSIEYAAKHLQPDVWFLSHDEIRQCGYDDDCAKRGLTPGQILADNIARCVGMVEEIDPGHPVVVWSDMFDPHHLAKQTEDDGSPFHHYLVKGDGPWWESWKGMPKRLGVVNWNNGNVPSVEFFDREGHQQILSHADPQKLVAWLDQTAGCARVAGCVYTTWSDDWRPLEAYAEAARGWFAAHPRR